MNSEGVDVNEMGVSYTLDEALEMVGFGKFQALVMAYAGLGAMAEAMEVMILSFIGTSVKDEWGLSPGQESFITSVVFGGMLFGAYLWGFISDNYGRRIGLLSVGAVTGIFAFLSAFSVNYSSLVIFRMVAGIGLGGGPVYSSWYLEFVPARNRGFWMVVFGTFWTIGTILEALLAWIIIPRFGWRWVLICSSVPCLLTLAFYSLTIESPRYLCLNNKFGDAHKILKQMAEMNKSQLPPGILVPHQTSERGRENRPSEGVPLLSIRKRITNSPMPGLSLFLTLLSSSLVKTTLLLWIIYFVNSFVYYGVVLLTTELSGGESGCGSILLLLAGSTLYMDVFITSFAEFPGLILSGLLVDKIGRRFSMVVMYLIGFIFLLPLLFHQNELITTSLLFGARMCFIGNYTVAGIYCPELYPTCVRTTGVGAATGVGRVAGIICPLVAVWLVSGCHQMAAIALFEVVLVVAGISVMLLPVETKATKLTDIVACSHNN
ncbi:Organic cation/carnitine transporter 7 [Striga hermonthica]|uniref:Organic cation/carnitine transporter 7 n=1 Tax=Striga hermonthica TaxID=68872 RepID=A0A9N7R0R1_STRHE|nr:Organic cation/carnitine transporter 7 [Striga hermonthica]